MADILPARTILTGQVSTKLWADPTGECVPRAAAAQRLLLAHDVLVLLLANEDAHVVRSWFIGMNPRLSGLSPAERIRSFDADTVRGAAQAFVEDTWGS